MYDVSPTQNHQVDGDIQVLDRKIDDLLGLAQNAETNIPENTPSQGMLRNINTWSTTTESSSTEHLNCNLGLLAPYDPVPDLEWPSSTDPELFTTPREFAIPAPIEPSATTLTRQSGRRMNPIPIQPRPAIPCGPSSTHMGPRSTGKVGQPSLNHSQAGARSSSIPSCGSLLIVEQLTQEFPLPNTRRTRRPYSKKTCLRCQEYKEKVVHPKPTLLMRFADAAQCTGGVPCHNCRNLWDKPRQRKCLLWTACFASDIRELNYQQECMYFNTPVFKLLNKQTDLAYLVFLDMCDIVETSTSLQFGKKIVDTSYDVVDRRESLRDMLILTVELLLSSAFGLSKDDWSPWSDPVPFVFYAINTYPRYVAELTNVDQLQFLFLKSASLGPTLNRIYKRLQRIKTGESTRLHLDLVLQVELLLIAVREPVSQAADIAETAVSWFMGEETKRDHVGRNSLVEELKDAVMRKEDQRKHLVLYLDWLVNKYKGSTVCNRSKLMISKLQNLGHDWRPAGSSGRVTQMRVEEAEKVLA